MVTRVAGGRSPAYICLMQSAFEFFFAAWPLIVVAILAFVMIRSARGPRQHGVRGDGDYARDAAKSQGRRGIDLDRGGGDGGGGGSD